MGGFPKLGGTILGVPIIRIIVLLGLHRGPLILGNYQVALNLNLWGLAENEGIYYSGIVWGCSLLTTGKLNPKPLQLYRETLPVLPTTNAGFGIGSLQEAADKGPGRTLDILGFRVLGFRELGLGPKSVLKLGL